MSAEQFTLVSGVHNYSLSCPDNQAKVVPGYDTAGISRLNGAVFGSAARYETS